MPFSILWGGFAIVWEFLAISRSQSPLFMLWGIPFVLMGLYFIFGRFIVKKRRKISTVYGLSDERAMVCTGDRSFADTPIRGVPTKVDRTRDGRHISVVFGYQSGFGLSGMYQNTGLDFFIFGLGPAVAFFDVADVDGLAVSWDRAGRGASDPSSMGA